jgi:ribonucleoside-diphosphate reductase alpha chain
MGFHGWLQKNSIPFENPVAKGQNMRFFKRFKDAGDAANKKLALERGACPDSLDVPECPQVRFSNWSSIAPTASISTIADASPSIEPNYANLFTQKTLDGAFEVRNPYLTKILESHGKNTQKTWTSIATHKGSVQHLDFLTEWEKEVFKTAFEIDQRWIVDHAADRTPFVCQSQSVNLFLHPDVSKTDLVRIHVRAWEKGVKSLYYLRSESIGGSVNVSKKIERVRLDEPAEEAKNPNDFSDCLSCQ